jgi:hypothetical protein
MKALERRLLCLKQNQNIGKKKLILHAPPLFLTLKKVV